MDTFYISTFKGPVQPGACVDIALVHFAIDSYQKVKKSKSWYETLEACICIKYSGNNEKCKARIIKLIR